MIPEKERPMNYYLLQVLAPCYQEQVPAVPKAQWLTAACQQCCCKCMKLKEMQEPSENSQSMGSRFGWYLS